MSRLHNEGSYELQSKLFKGGYLGNIWGSIIGVIKGDTRSLDYSSYSDPLLIRAEG